jgi:hypothetical protein
MARVKKLLNMVRGCGIRGRLGCGAASIGYRRRIRKRFVHSRCHPAVTELLSSNKLTMEPDARWGTPGCGERRKAVGRHRRVDPPTSTRAFCADLSPASRPRFEIAAMQRQAKRQPTAVMAGLVPAIHALLRERKTTATTRAADHRRHPPR